MALSLGQHRAQLLHRTKATDPRPCFDRPLFLLFFVIVVGEEQGGEEGKALESGQGANRGPREEDGSTCCATAVPS